MSGKDTIKSIAKGMTTEKANDVLKENGLNGRDEKFMYMLLGRMQSDCKFFLGFGGRYAPSLWAKEVTRHITIMLALWTALSEKPTWCTYDNIIAYGIEMAD